MSDEEVFPDDDISGGDDDGGKQKVGFLPAIVITILKYAAIGIGAIAFIVTVVVVTMSILDKGPSGMEYPEVSPDYEGKKQLLDWWSGIDDIRTRTSDEQDITILAKIKIGYKQGDNSLLTELNARQPQLQEKVRYYFSSHRASYIKEGENSFVKTELIELINTELSTGQIRDVVILDLQMIEM